MSRFDDNYDSPDESEDTDPIIRELRTEIIRLEAQLDQLTASVRERAEEAVIIRVQLAELEARLTQLEARCRRDALFLTLAWLMVSTSFGLWLYRYLAP
jgi:uncharacterized protein involved in exopolysaccharide biosynthesis